MVKITTYLKSNYWLIAILLFAALLRLFRLDHQSAWLDEIWTLFETNPNQSFKEVYDTMMTAEQQPPLYFYLVYFALKIFGYTPLVLRFISAVAGIAGVYALYLLGKELFSKYVGLLAALLLAGNEFHLGYSQEGRPYAFFFFFIVLGFYRLLVFIKTPSWRNALWYGIFAGLMINGHFFGLFALLAQCFILFFFLLIAEKDARKSFLTKSAVSGLIAVIFFLPSLQLFFAAAAIKKTWIPLPAANVYTDIFEGFFGHSELVVALITIAALFYFIRLYQERELPIRYDAVIDSRIVLSAVVIFPWIMAVLLIALVRSHISVPMIVDRYFISVLPALLLMVAIGIDGISNTIVKSGLILLYVVFSLTSIVVINRFYTNVRKAQFRELSQSIIDNNRSGDPVVSRLGLHFKYLLKNDKVQYPIIHKPLEEYVREVMQDSTRIRSFWYADGHHEIYAPSDSAKHFIEQHFILEKDLAFYDTWAKHFIKRPSADSLKLLR